MVAAIVVRGVLLVVLGMNTWAFQAYGGKIDQMSGARRDALFVASHSCERALGDDPDDYTVPQLRGNNASGGVRFGLMDIIDAVRGRGELDFFGTARSQKGPTAVLGTALTRVGASGATRTPLRTELRTASAVGCNEKPLGEGILALLSLGWNALQGLFR
jgi:hypothetical protein